MKMEKRKWVIKIIIAKKINNKIDMNNKSNLLNIDSILFWNNLLLIKLKKVKF